MYQKQQQLFTIYHNKNQELKIKNFVFKFKPQADLNKYIKQGQFIQVPASKLHQSIQNSLVPKAFNFRDQKILVIEINQDKVESLKHFTQLIESIQIQQVIIRSSIQTHTQTNYKIQSYIKSIFMDLPFSNLSIICIDLNLMNSLEQLQYFNFQLVKQLSITNMHQFHQRSQQLYKKGNLQLSVFKKLNMVNLQILNVNSFSQAAVLTQMNAKKMHLLAIPLGIQSKNQKYVNLGQKLEGLYPKMQSNKISSFYIHIKSLKLRDTKKFKMICKKYNQASMKRQ